MFEVMMHKKLKHEDEVPFCRHFKEGKCTFQKCWFRHKPIQNTKASEATYADKTVTNESDFTNAKNQTKPPESQISELTEIILRAMKMITSVEDILQVKQKQMSTDQ